MVRQQVGVQHITSPHWHNTSRALSSFNKKSMENPPQDIFTENPEAEALAHGIFSSAMDAIISVDESQQIVLFNTAAEKMFGCTTTEALWQPLDRFLPERFREAHRNHIQTFGKNHVTHRRMGQLGSIVGLRANGEEFPIEASISHAEIGGKKLYTVILRDISVQQHEKQAHKIHEQCRKALSDFSQAAVDCTDVSVLMEKAVHLLAEALDVPFTKILELLPNKQELIIQYGIGWKKQAVGRAKVSADPTTSQAGFALKSSSPVVVENLRTDPRFNGPPLLTRHGIISGISATIYGQDEPYGVLGVHTASQRTFSQEEIDVVHNFANILTDAIRQSSIEDTLEKERDWNKLILDSTGALVVVLDSQGRIVRFNPTSEQVTGYLAQEVIGQYVWDYFILPEEQEAVKSVFATLKSGGLPSRYENNWRIRNGETRYIAWSNTTALDKSYNVEYIISSGIDLTDLKASQEALQKAEQLAQLGTLASGMAHEIGTPMNIILGRAETLLRKTSEEPTKKGLATIIQQIERMTHLIHQLLNVARRTPYQPRHIDLKNVVNNVLNLIEERVAETQVAVETQWTHDEVFLIHGDSEYLEQVFLNLCVNAIHAMPQGGTLRLGLDLSNNQVRATVEDTGEGISPDHLPKIFQPFFSTKSKENGTGLGLMMTQSIIEEHGGTISVDSLEGQGTTFTVRIPVLSHDPTA